jgi:hypothetical protein
MPKLYNLARMTTATTGTGTITLGVAVSGYLSFANAGVVNSDIVFYGIKDASNSEVGWGTYTSSGTTLTRNVAKSTNSNSLISLSGSAEVYITALASDGGDLIPGFTNPMRGFDLPLNLQINASVASNILTVAIKGNNGSDPSNSNPILIPFRDSTAANGGPIWRTITGALSINTNATGATLGVPSSPANQPFRLWLAAADNAGSMVLALWQSVSWSSGVPVAWQSWTEAVPANTTGISGSATLAGTWYTPNGVALTGKSIRILGYLEWGSGLATPGSYASGPTAIQLFGPGIEKPGDAVQSKTGFTSTGASTTGATYLATNLGLSFAPSASPNLALVALSGSMAVSAAASTQRGYIKVFRSGTACAGSPELSFLNTGSNYGAVPASAYFFDAPGSVSSQTYDVRIKADSGETVFFPDNTGFALAQMTIQEIMV